MAMKKENCNLREIVKRLSAESKKSEMEMQTLDLKFKVRIKNNFQSNNY